MSIMKAIVSTTMSSIWEKGLYEQFCRTLYVLALTPGMDRLVVEIRIMSMLVPFSFRYNGIDYERCFLNIHEAIR